MPLDYGKYPPDSSFRLKIFASATSFKSASASTVFRVLILVARYILSDVWKKCDASLCRVITKFKHCDHGGSKFLRHVGTNL
jgi:hypothetical protein